MKIKKKQPKRIGKEILIEFCTEELRILKTQKQVIKAFMKEFGYSMRQATRYVEESKALLLERINRNALQHSSDSYEFYVKAINSDETEWRDKIRAREALDKLLGIQGFKAAAATGSISINQFRESIAQAVLLVVEMLAQDPALRAAITARQTEIADLIQSKYGNVEQSKATNGEYKH